MKLRCKSLTPGDKKVCKMIEMSPGNFLSLAIPIHRGLYDTGSLKSIKKGIKKEAVFYAPYLTVDVDTCRVIDHEGRHRAHAAKTMGIKKMCVRLCFKKREEKPSTFWGVTTRWYKYIDEFDIEPKDVKCEVSDLKKQLRRR